MTSNEPFFRIVSRTLEWAGRELTLEVGRVARQAQGAVMARYGDTMVLCTVCVNAETVNPHFFLPLSVHYQEKFYAAGRVPGGFLKRESKPSDREILVARYVDRMLRPLFPEDFFHEVQIVCTVLSYDASADPGVVALVGASAALAVSGLPLEISAGVRVGRQEGRWVLNPVGSESDVDLLLGATAKGVTTIEGQVDELAEAQVIEALKFGHEALKPVFTLIEDLREGVCPAPFKSLAPPLPKLVMSDAVKQSLQDLCGLRERSGRNAHLRGICRDWVAQQVESFKVSEAYANDQFYKHWRALARDYILAHNVRLDGRDFQEIRPIFCEVGLLPRCHGSALFTRGDTQALVTVTMGSRQDDSQVVERLSGVEREYFMLQYNFPPYAVGESGKLMGPGRREIGHGRLARKALLAALPKNEHFSVRVVSEITESCGSSSMATVCGASLALMDAGIPFKAPCAGIAMGMLFTTGQAEPIVLSDISGTEDFLGDMDFKVAGTSLGVTAIQVDLKVTHLPLEHLEKALEQARLGRLHILQHMAQQSLSVSRKSFNARAPRVVQAKVPVEKIRDLVGTGGRNIKSLCEATHSKIEIGEDGTLSIFSTTEEDSKKVLEHVKRLVQGPQQGEIYDGVVKKIMDFGAFVSFGFPQDGLVHVSEIAMEGERLSHPSERLREGQSVKVRVKGVDRSGKVQLSIRQA